MVYNPKTKRVTRVYSCVFEETLVGVNGHPIDALPEEVVRIEGEGSTRYGSAPTAPVESSERTDSEEESDNEEAAPSKHGGDDHSV